MSEGTRREWVWESRTWPDALWVVGIAGAFGLMFYFIGETAPAGQGSGLRPAVSLKAGLGVFGFMLAFFGVLLGVTPRRVVVSEDAIEVRNRLFGGWRLRRDEIAGVRPPVIGARRAQLWIQRKNGKMLVLPGVEDLRPREPSAAEVAYRIFGGTEEQRGWEAAVAAEAARTATDAGPRRFEFKRARVWGWVLDAACALMVAGCAVFHQTVLEWIVQRADEWLALTAMGVFSTAACILATSLVMGGVVAVSGGRVLWMEVTADGIVVQRSRKRIEIGRERIEGISTVPGPLKGDGRKVRVHLKPRGWYEWRLRDLDASPEAVVGALSARFGLAREQASMVSN